MRKEEVNIYKYDELSDAAKENARKWYENILDNDFTCESDMITDSLKEKLRDFLPDSTDDIKIYWNCSYSQGDGVALEGTLSNSDIEQIARNYFGPRFWLYAPLIDDIYIKVESSHRSYYTNIIDLTMDYISYDAPRLFDLHDQFIKHLKDVIDDIEGTLKKMAYDEIDYHYSQKNIEENIIINEYEFLENGERW